MVSLLVQQESSGMIIQQGAFEIINGSVVLEDNTSITIGPATVIPEPWNRQLAKEILGYRSEIEKLKIELDTEIKKFDVFKEASREREDKIKNYMTEKYRAVKLENIILNSFWNKQGKIIIWAVASGAAAALGTYLFCRETSKYGC